MVVIIIITILVIRTFHCQGCFWPAYVCRKQTICQSQNKTSLGGNQLRMNMKKEGRGKVGVTGC